MFWAGQVGEPPEVISGVIIHLQNELPIIADLESIPGPGDRLVRCTNVRTVDGKRPQFVHDRNSTFIFPVSVIRLIEAPAVSSSTAVARQDGADEFDESTAPPPPDAYDDDAEESFLARVRQA